MKRQRQLQHVLEKVGRHHVAPTMGQPVGKPGDQRRRDNDKQAKANPSPDQRRQHARGRIEAGGQRSRQPINDTAEQHRLDELRHRERDVGDRQRDREPRLRCEQRQNAPIDPKKRHGVRQFSVADSSAPMRLKYD